MKDGRNLWEALDLPGETFPGQVLIEIAGESRVLIEGHKGVREYSREQIGIHVRYGTVMVCGSCLELRCMTRDQMIITGKIDAVELRRGS